MVKHELSRFKKVGTAGVVLLSLAVLAGCSGHKTELGTKILQIDNTKATKIVSLGTLTEKQVKKVEDLSKSEVKNDNVVASDGTEIPQKQVEDVVSAINSGDDKTVETALEKAPEVKSVISDKTSGTSNSSKKLNNVEQAKVFVDEKVDGQKVQQELEKTGTSVDAEEAEGIAKQRNLANVIQLNAQKKFPDDVIAISAKRNDGTYVLRDISSGDSYVISVDGSGNITKMVGAGNS